jgi:2-methylisocitrate lyase-like PEP mutase family enzyme
MKSATSLRRRIEDGSGIVVAVGAHDPLTALIAANAGMEAVYHGGYAVAAHQYGLPDLGLIGAQEMMDSLQRITSVVDVAVIVDADTGYGSEPGVWRTMQGLERRGAAAVQIEDQVSPKRCGHMEGKNVIPVDEMVAKVRAAADARVDPETLLIARTDALQVNGLADAIDRCLAYAEAGADVTFVDAPSSREQLAEIVEAVRPASHVMANMTETGKTPAMTAQELEALGYSLVIFPSSQSWLFVRAYEELCAELLATGTTAGIADRFKSFDEVNELVGKSRWDAIADEQERR